MGVDSRLLGASSSGQVGRNFGVSVLGSHLMNTADPDFLRVSSISGGLKGKNGKVTGDRRIAGKGEDDQ